MAQHRAPESVRTRPNYFYSIISVALVLFLLGFFGLILLQAQELIRVFKEKVSLIVELRENTAHQDVVALENALRQQPFMKTGSLDFISREEAARSMQDEFGDEFLQLDLPNPFHDVITFNVGAAYMNPDSLQAIRQQLRADPVISDVFYQESLVDNIAANIRELSYITLGIGLFFIFVAVTLIHNTIRLALFANRFLIKNMELVGASWAFISRPYLLRALAHGLISGLIAVAGLLFFLYWASVEVPELTELYNLPAFALLFGLLLLAGILINAASTYFVVKKYLRLRVDDLY